MGSLVLPLGQRSNRVLAVAPMASEMSVSRILILPSADDPKLPLFQSELVELRSRGMAQFLSGAVTSASGLPGSASCRPLERKKTRKKNCQEFGRQLFFVKLKPDYVANNGAIPTVRFSRQRGPVSTSASGGTYFQLGTCAWVHSMDVNGRQHSKKKSRRLGFCVGVPGRKRRDVMLTNSLGVSDVSSGMVSGHAQPESALPLVSCSATEDAAVARALLSSDFLILSWELQDPRFYQKTSAGTPPRVVQQPLCSGVLRLRAMVSTQALGVLCAPKKGAGGGVSLKRVFCPIGARNQGPCRSRTGTELFIHSRIQLWIQYWYPFHLLYSETKAQLFCETAISAEPSRVKAFHCSRKLRSFEWD